MGAADGVVVVRELGGGGWLEGAVDMRWKGSGRDERNNGGRNWRDVDAREGIMRWRGRCRSAIEG